MARATPTPRRSEADTLGDGPQARPAVVVRDLRKAYGDVLAVAGLSFDVPAGALFAFLGANGAGKSTTIGCVTTTIVPTSGSVEVQGVDVLSEASSAREHIGVVFQPSLLDPLLTVRENLTVRAGFYRLPRREITERVGQLSALVDLDDVLDRRYGRLSGGQKRRADIARALVHRPSVVFLDEPTAGLDPQSRERIWASVDELRREHGTTVFLTTHYMEETERADRVCIIDHGRIVADGTPAELRARYSSSILTARSARPDELLTRLSALGLGDGVERRREDVLIPVASSAEARSLLGQLELDDFEFRHGTMDDVFLAVTREVAS